MRGEAYIAENERLGVQELLQQRVAAVVAIYSLAEDSLNLLERWKVPVVFVDSLRLTTGRITLSSASTTSPPLPR